MSSKIFLSPAAEKDIDEIVTYLAQENPVAAHAFLDSLSISPSHL
jgi:antitoxin ParD1/3/4